MKPRFFEILEEKSIRKNNILRKYFICKCQCGKIFEARKESILKNKYVSCGCKNSYWIKKGKESTTWRGVGDISAEYFAQIKDCAKRRNLKINVTLQQIWDLFQKQEGKCALTGIPICFKQSKRTNEPEQTASLDRIDSNKHYDIDNIQWVHKDVNRMKQEFTEDYFYQMCKAVVNKKEQI